MKKALSQICLIIFLGLFIYSLNAKAEPPGPRIFIAEPTFDAKDVKSSEYLEHDFKVVNKGDATLEITDVKPG